MGDRREKHYSDNLRLHVWPKIAVEEGNDEEVFCGRVYQCTGIGIRNYAAAAPHAYYIHTQIRARVHISLRFI